ncbi:MAG: hypothetical protein EHM14_05250, partial [Methanothrix sp.]
MASVEDKLDALISAEIYRSRDEVISDAMSALLTLKPSLKIDMAVNLYKNKKVSLWRGADIASLTLEKFKDILASRSIRIEHE